MPLKVTLRLNELEAICLDQVITIGEAVTILTVSKKRVRDLCVSGKLIARQAGSTWLISKTSVEDRKNEAFNKRVSDS